MRETKTGFNLKRYINENGYTPTKEENMQTIQRVKAGDKQAMDKLILTNGRLVLSYISHNCPQYSDNDDIFQQGVMSLIEAAKKYDESKETSFSTYCYIWIRQYINKYIYNNITTIRIPEHEIPKFYLLRKLKDQFENEVTEETDFLTYVLNNSNITKSEYDTLRPFLTKMASLNTPIGETEHGEITELGDMLSDEVSSSGSDYIIEKEDLEQKAITSERDSILKKAIEEVLTEQQRDVLCRRFGFYYGMNNYGSYELETTAVAVEDDNTDDEEVSEKEVQKYSYKETLESIAKDYNVTRERIRQIEAKAIEKIFTSKYSKELSKFFFPS